MQALAVLAIRIRHRLAGTGWPMLHSRSGIVPAQHVAGARFLEALESFRLQIGENDLTLIEQVRPQLGENEATRLRGNDGRRHEDHPKCETFAAISHGGPRQFVKRTAPSWSARCRP